MYAWLQNLDTEQAARIRRAMAEKQWHFMDEDEREQFLMTWLPGYVGLHDLLADFRFGGYRVLSALICDIDDENTTRDRRQSIREGDSPTFVLLMETYQNKSNTQTYREAVSAKCRALCAWCSVPDPQSTAPKKDWQFLTDFRSLHDEFPELVDENGCGWFWRHVHRVADFVENNPELVSSSAADKARKIKKGFDEAWRNKVRQFQVPLYSPDTKCRRPASTRTLGRPASDGNTCG